MAGTEGRDVIIAIAELLGYVTLEMAQGSEWKGQLTLYAGDNTNVIGWLGSRSSSNRYVSHLLRVLTFS